MRALVTVLPLFFLGVQAHWTYSGEGLTEDQWPKEYPDCGGQKQSPIDLVRQEVKFNPSLKRLNLTGYREEGLEFPMTNNGHTVQITLPNTMYIQDSEGNLYRSEQLHFHWGGGPSGISGSEHTVDGIRHVMEIHLVHFSDKYDSFDEAKSQPDGLAVMAVFVEIEEYDENTYYGPFISELHNIKHPGQTTTLKDTTIRNMLPRNTRFYYTYEGSLTTPPCTENVKWFVLKESVRLSKTQVERIENAIKNQDNETLHDGYRKTQPVNHRVVEANFPFFHKLVPKIDRLELEYVAHYAGPKNIEKRKQN